jgi:hypothetical protein
MDDRVHFKEKKLLIRLIEGGNKDKAALLDMDISLNFDWAYLIEKAKKEGVFYPVYEALTWLDSRRNIFPKDIRDRFKQLYYHYISQSTEFFQQVTQILSGIESSGIKILLLKGPTIDFLLYKEDLFRPRVDLDVTVRENDFAAFEKLLISWGYSNDLKKEKYPIPEHLNSRIYFKEEDPAVPLHVHRHIINNLYLMVDAISVDIERVWQETARFKNYNNVFCLKPELQILYMCEHALKHNYTQLIYLYEIKGLLDCYQGQLDWKKLVALSDEFNLSRALYYGLYFTEQVLSAGLPPNILKSLKPDKITLLERFFIKRTLRRSRVTYLSYVVYLSAQEGLLKKMEFLFKTIFPPKFTVLGNLTRVRKLAELFVNSR